MENKKYKPTLREIAKEMGTPLVREYSKASNAIRRGFKNIGDLALGGLFGGTTGLVGGYITPSAIRYFRELKQNCSVEEEPSSSMIIGGRLGTLLTGASQGLGYGYFCEKGHPEVLLIPLVTNLASGLYEWYNHSKNKVIREHQTEEEQK